MKSFATPRQLLLIIIALASLPAAAQSRAADICKSGLCSSHGKTITAREAMPPASFDLRVAWADPANEWKQHIQTRDGEEDYNCALSMTVGGELKRDGFIGARMFGRSLTLKRPGADGSR